MQSFHYKLVKVPWVLENLFICLNNNNNSEEDDIDNRPLRINIRTSLLRVLRALFQQREELSGENLEHLFVFLSRLDPNSITADFSSTIADIICSGDVAMQYIHRMDAYTTILPFLDSSDESARAHGVSMMASFLRWCSPEDRHRIIFTEDIFAAMGEHLARHRPGLPPAVRDALWHLVAVPVSSSWLIDTPRALSVFLQVILHNEDLALGMTQHLNKETLISNEGFVRTDQEEVVQFLESFLSILLHYHEDSLLFKESFVWLPGLVAIYVAKEQAKCNSPLTHQLILDILVHLFLLADDAPLFKCHLMNAILSVLSLSSEDHLGSEGADSKCAKRETEEGKAIYGTDIGEAESVQVVVEIPSSANGRPSVLESQGAMNGTATVPVSLTISEPITSPHMTSHSSHSSSPTDCIFLHASTLTILPMTFREAFIELFCALCETSIKAIELGASLPKQMDIVSRLYLFIDHILLACGLPFLLSNNITSLIEYSIAPLAFQGGKAENLDKDKDIPRFVPSPLLGVLVSECIAKESPLLLAIDQTIACVESLLQSAHDLAEIDRYCRTKVGGFLRLCVRLACFRLLLPSLISQTDENSTNQKGDKNTTYLHPTIPSNTEINIMRTSSIKPSSSNAISSSLEILNGPGLRLFYQILQRNECQGETMGLIFATLASLTVRVYKSALTYSLEHKRPTDTTLNQLVDLLKAAVCSPGASDILSSFSGADGLPLLPRLLPLIHSGATIPCAMHLSSMQWLFALSSYGSTVITSFVSDCLTSALSEASNSLSIHPPYSTSVSMTSLLNPARAVNNKIIAIANVCRLEEEALLSRHRVLAHKSWLAVLDTVTNERGVWTTFSQGCSWLLDFTEDNLRRRLRLLPIHNTFNLERALVRQRNSSVSSEDIIMHIRQHQRVRSLSPEQEQQEQNDLKHQQHSALGSPAQPPRHFLRSNEYENISFNSDATFESCDIITFQYRIHCFFKVTRTHVFIIVDENSSVYLNATDDVRAELDAANSCWTTQDIQLVLRRRFLLQHTAIEIFLANRHTQFINFADEKVASNAILSLVPLIGSGDDSTLFGLPSLVRITQDPQELFKLSPMTKRWQAREVSNFEYLMFLNTLSGRTYHDLGQYPVFPWVLQCYENKILDLDDPSSYRDLSRPMGALTEVRRHHAQERFESWEDESIPAFHHGTHYSTPAYVLFWLTRMLPFARLLHSMQGGSFDLASRAFTSIPLAWESTISSTSDVKELIPELFYQPVSLLYSSFFQISMRSLICKKKKGKG